MKRREYCQVIKPTKLIGCFIAGLLLMGDYVVLGQVDCQCHASAAIVADGTDDKGNPANTTVFRYDSNCWATNYASVGNILVTPCSHAQVYIGAYACASAVGLTTSITYKINSGTCEITSDGQGNFTVEVTDQDKAGSVTFIADAVGPCEDGSSKHAHEETTISFDPGSGGCSSCNNPNPPGPPGPRPGVPGLGTGNGLNDSVNFTMALGLRAEGGHAGYLQVYADHPTNTLAQPSSLIVTFPRPDVLIITNSSGVIQQVKPPQGLIVVSNLNSYSYKLLCIDATNVTGISSGLYTYTVTPIVTWLVENPDGASATNRIWFTEIRSGATNRVFQYTYTNAGWNLLLPDGNTMVQTSQSGSVGITNKVRNTYSGSQLVSSETATFQTISGFDHPLLLQTTKGNGAAIQNTVYTYYNSDPTNGISTNRLQRIDYSDGRWVYFIYDDYGHVATKYESFLNNPAPAANTVPDPASIGCKVTTYTYSPPGSIKPWEPRTTIVQLPVDNGGGWSLTTVSYETHSFGYYDGDSYGNNILTEQVYQNTTQSPVRRQIQTYVLDLNYYGDDLTTFTNVYRYGRPRSESHPDGTVTIYDYCANADGSLTISNRTGAIGGSGNWANPGDLCNIVDGIETVERRDALGQTLSKCSRDIVSGLTVSRFIYTPLSSYVSGRDYQVVDIAGLTNSYIYNCCNLETATDPNGVVIGYGYDLLKRSVSSTVFYGGASGITTTRFLDGAGRVYMTQRTGTNGSSITLGKNQYDILGRIIAQTNALGGVTLTSYSPTNCQQSVTNIYPNGGTRIEKYYLDGQLQSVTGTAVHGVAYGYGADTDVNGNTCTFSVVTNLDRSGNPTSEWTKTYSDMAGRTTEVLYADGSYSQSFYNDNNQLWKQVDPDGVIMLYQYNAKGEATLTAVDMDKDDDIGFRGADHITATTNEVVTAHDTAVRRSSTYAWTADGSDAPSLLSVSEISTNGLNSWQIKYGDANTCVTNQTTTIYSGSSRSITAIAPDGSYVINTYSYGRLVSSTRYDSSTAQIGGTTIAYDPHGRQYQMTDARNGTTTYGYNNADQVNSVTTPNPGGGSPEVTTTYYNTSLQATNVVQPDGTTVTSTYLLTGELVKQSGSRTYPVAYSYDYAGRMQTMTNWSTFSSLAGARVTTWNYDTQRGFLASKVYDDGHGPSYTYTPAGRLQSRAWVRLDGSGNPLTTSYAYDNAGSLTNIAYSDSTPSVTNSYDRLGRLVQQTTPDYQLTSTYNLANELLTEVFAGGALDGLSVTNGYDQYLRRTNLTALGSSVLSRTSYSYDNASRLSTVSDGTDNATYSYLANSPLVSQILFKSNSVTRMATTKAYDYLNRLTAITSQPSGAGTPPVSFNYTYNTANQRTKNVLADGSYWGYQYDALGQVTGGVKYFYDGTLVPGQQFGYGFDDIGNRKQTTAGGDAAGANLRTANYWVNSLNQITQRDYPGTNDVTGVALATNGVTVNGQSAWRKGEYFWATVKSNNTASAQWEGIKVASGGITNSGNLYVPKTPEQLSYDADGNLTNDGRWSYVWDAENRLIQMTVNTNVGPQYQLTFAYDAKSRRIQKQVISNSVSLYTNKFLYDGWNLMAELKPDNTQLRTYVWGTDLSGSLQGAGGVGGLLEVSRYGTSTTNCFPAFDGNGNVMALINAADGTSLANYAYGPFGELIQQTGIMAGNNPMRFSTKYQDDESDLLYYGYRYYKPSTGTWPNRDPIEEQGGINLYGFAHACPINFVDTLGLAETLPNPVIPPLWPSGSGPGGIAPPSIPPSSGSGIGNPGSGSPVQPPRVPPSAPGKPGKGDTSAGGAAGIIGIDVNLLLDAIAQSTLNDFMERGRAACLAQAKKTGGCCGCCMINLYLTVEKYRADDITSKQLFYNSAIYYNKPCFQVEADVAAASGQPSIGPDYRRYDYLWFPYRRAPIDDQYYRPQFETVCSK